MFLAAHRALLNGTSPREPAAWLATIARNECWARIRTRMREPLPAAALAGESSPSDPLADAIRNADLAAMWGAIAELPRQQRDALLLREFGGLSYEELAGALAVSGSAVESLLFRARQGVRARLKTAYAGLTGASWIDSLARLAGGLGGGMAPVAAKVAAVSVGAAVVTGGAVVAPQLLGHARVSHHTAPRRAAPVTIRRAAVQPVPVFFTSTRLPAAPGAGRDGGSSRDSVESGTPAGGHVESSDAGQQDNGFSSDGQPAAPARGDGGEVAATTLKPAVTVTVPTGDEPPAQGGSDPGDDG